MKNINFLIELLAFNTLFSSVLVITSKNPVIAIIFLISVFINASGYLILNGISFIGITYIILYVGAIIVLFLFIIMMINIKLSDILEAGSQYTKNIPLALIIGSCFLYEILNIMPFTLNNVSIISILLNILTKLNILFLNSEINNLITVNTTYDSILADTVFIPFLQIQAIGQGLYTYGAIYLILCSMILLLAIITPLFIAKDNSNPSESN
jgi:NADH-ubiquinone oxidoreductase chain 6